MPAYNAARTIQAALDSITAQTVPTWEVIVVDDGSTDSTSKLVKRLAKFDARISLVQKKNGGESDARNAGVAAAKSDWLAFLDADDWVSPFYLKRLTEELSAHPELDAVHCGSIRVAQDGTYVSDDYQPPAGDLFPILARRAAFPVNACIVRKALVESVGMFDKSLKKSPDWDLWQRIARTGARFGAVRDMLAYYRMTPNSSSLGARQLLRDGLTVLKRGHAHDPRVPNPHPDYVNGLQTDRVETQEFYLLSWCAGLTLGIGQDARPLIKILKEDRYEGLYPDAIARCIFEAATLPMCKPRNAWDTLWPDVYPLARKFLMALEKQSGTPDLAQRAFMELMKLTLKHSATWGPVMQEAEEKVARQDVLLKQLDQHRADLQGERDRWRQVCHDLENQKRTLEEEYERSKLSERNEQALETQRAEWQALSDKLEAQKRTLQEDLERTEAERTKWQQLSEELDIQRAAVQESLNHASLLVGSLEKDKAALEHEVVRWQRMVDAVEEEKAQVDSSRREWWRVAEQRAMLIAEMEDSLWFRIGARLKILDLHKKNETDPSLDKA